MPRSGCRVCCARGHRTRASGPSAWPLRQGDISPGRGRGLPTEGRNERRAVVCLVTRGQAGPSSSYASMRTHGRNIDHGTSTWRSPVA